MDIKWQTEWKVPERNLYYTFLYFVYESYERSMSIRDLTAGTIIIEKFLPASLGLWDNFTADVQFCLLVPSTRCSSLSVNTRIACRKKIESTQTGI